MKVFVITKRMLAAAGAVLALGAVLVTLHATGAADLVAAVSAKRELPIYSVQTDNKLVALSFDAAWANASYVQSRQDGVPNAAERSSAANMP